jgi:putative restriction endonuclease
MDSHPFIGVTDKAWFDFLASQAPTGRIDEANFWSPKSVTRIKAMAPGTPFFLRLKHPWNAIAGYGFFAHFSVLDLDSAWDLFGWKNGDSDKLRFLTRIGRYRKVDLLDPASRRDPIGCTVLRSVDFWPQARWMPWGERMGWEPNIVKGKTERDASRATLLLSQIAADRSPIPDDLTDEPFVLVDADNRQVELARQAMREGQGAFRARLLDAYDGRCAITGEHTRPVLDAAHIQPYLGPASNHLQNGLVLTKEFHALFDLGYVTVTPDYEIRISPGLQDRWHNGKRYYPYDGRQLTVVPKRAADRPSRRALEWHADRVFRRVG